MKPENNIENQMAAALERAVADHPELNRSMLSTIHHPDNNDALVVARIAQNMYPLNAGFFNLMYDHLIIEEMASGPFIDTEGNQREIIIDPNATVPARTEGNNLIIAETAWVDKDLQALYLKSVIGAWLLGISVDNKKSGKKHERAIRLRVTHEFTAFSDLMNKSFYEYSEDKLRALALTIVELGYNFIIPFCPEFCTDEEYNEMYTFACEGIFESMDAPSDKPLIRAFNTALPNALFLDNRAANIRRIFTGIEAQVGDNKDLRMSLPLDYMAQCMTLVRF